MTDSKDLSKRTVAQLEELLMSQRVLLKNVKFLAKLPDKGAKLKTSVVALEEELKRRKEEVPRPAQPFVNLSSSELEWKDLGSGQLLNKIKKPPQQLDSDDESEEDADDGTNDCKDDNEFGEVNPLRLLATSQFSQNQPKTIIPPPKHSPGELSSKLKNLELHETEKKFKPHQSLLSTKSSPSSSPVDKAKPSSPSIIAPPVGSSPCKYFECLVSDKLEFGPIKYLSFNESLKCEEEYQIKIEEAQKSELSHSSDKVKKSGKVYALGDTIKKVTFQNEEDNKEFIKALQDVRDNGIDVVNGDAVSEVSEDSDSQLDSDDEDEDE